MDFTAVDDRVGDDVPGDAEGRVRQGKRQRLRAVGRNDKRNKMLRADEGSAGPWAAARRLHPRASPGKGEKPRHEKREKKHGHGHKKHGGHDD